MSSSWQRWIPWLMAISSLIGILIGQKMSDTAMIFPSQGSHGESSEENKLSQISRLIQQNHIDNPDVKLINNWAVEGIFQNLDPYSRYIESGDDRLDRSFLSNMRNYGFKAVFDSDSLLVYRSAIGDVRIGDKIVRIDGNPVKNLTSVSKYFAKSDSIELELMRSGTSFHVSLKKSDFELEERRTAMVFQDEIVYLRPGTLKKGSYQEIMRKMEEMGLTEKPLKLIVDLRSNRGGDVEETVKLINQFVGNKERQYLTIQYGNGKVREYSSTGKSFLNPAGLAILINEGTTSSAEIIAGSLKGMNHVQVIGAKSKGKRQIQRPFKLEDGSSIYITVGEYKFEKEDTVEIASIVPDITVGEGHYVEANRSKLNYVDWVETCSEGDSNYKWTYSSENEGDSLFDPRWLEWSDNEDAKSILLNWIYENDPAVLQARAWLNPELSNKI